MLIRVILINFILWIQRNAALYENETTVYDVNNLKLQNLIGNNKYVLTVFYIKGCPMSQKYVPEYIFLSKLLKELFKGEIIVSSMNAWKNLYSSQLYNIKAFPSVILFVDGKPTPSLKYLEAIPLANELIWRIKQTPLEMQSVSMVEAVMKKLKYVLMGFFKNKTSPEFKVFADFVRGNREINWILVSNDTFFNLFNVKNSSHMIIFRQYDDPRIDYSGEYNLKRVSRYYFAYSCPYLTYYIDNSQKIPAPFIANVTEYVIGFTDSTHKKYSLHKALLTKSAKYFMGTVKFIHTNVDETSSYYLEQLFNVKKTTEIPSYFYLRYNPNTSEINIYKPSDPKMTSKRVVEFVIKVLKGQVEPHRKSEKLNPHWNKVPVKILVRDNYVDVTNNPNATVFVQICSYLCKQCSYEQNLMHTLALSYKDRSDVWITTIDGSKNDFDNLTISDFPLYKLYPKQSNKSIDFLGNRTLTNFQNFIDSNGKINPEVIIDDSTIEESLQEIPSYITNEIIENKMSLEDSKILLNHIAMVKNKHD